VIVITHIETSDERILDVAALAMVEIVPAHHADAIHSLLHEHMAAVIVLHLLMTILRLS
jgi:hypothetical protein